MAKRFHLLVKITVSISHFKLCNIQVFQGTLKMAKDNGMLCDIDENLLFPNVNKLYKV